jgi:predicted Zn-dependent peptidase
MTIKTITYPNGFRVVYEKSPKSTPISCIEVLCDIGSVYESNETRGISHFIEHMCFKGTKNIPIPKNIFIEYDKIGAYLNATTDKRYTYYTIKCSNEYVENSIHIMSDMLLNSIFNKTEYKKEEKVVIEENIKDVNDAEEILFENLDKLLYNGSSYAFPVDTIAYHKGKLDYKTVIDMYNYFYQPNKMVLSVVSNLSFVHIKQMVEKTFFVKNPVNQIQIPNKYPIYSFVLPQNEIQYNIQKQNEITTGHIAIGFRTNYCDKYALRLLKVILSGPMSSRLFMLLREENGLTYTSSVLQDYYDLLGEFIFYAETDSTKIMKNGSKMGVLPLIIKLINELIKHGITEDELQFAKNYLKGDIELDLENNDNLALHNGEKILVYPNEKIVPYSKIYDTFYKNITKKDVENVIKRYLNKKNMSICIVSENLPALDKIKEQCEKIIS